MSDNFEFLTEEDKNSLAYNACIGGTTLTGLALGRFAGLQGIIIGGVAGLAWGLLTCKYVKEPIKHKLFSTNAILQDQELGNLLNIIRSKHPSITKKDALELLAQVRNEVSKNSSNYKAAIS